VSPVTAGPANGNAEGQLNLHAAAAASIIRWNFHVLSRKWPRESFDRNLILFIRALQSTSRAAHTAEPSREICETKFIELFV
jgi:hypothetical protein